MTDRILILDFGSQFTQLIARRIREVGVYCEIMPYNVDPQRIADFAPRGIIFSGGPASVTEAGTPRAPKLAFAAGPLTSSLQGFVQDQVQQVIASERFQQFWVSANTILQKQVVAVLDGNSDVLTVQGNQVVFNYLPLLNDALTQLSGTLSAILNRQITLPTITADTVPSEAVASLQTALGVTLPPTFGSVTLFQSDELTSVQDAVSIFNKTMILAIVLFILGVALALVLSTNRRRTLLQLVTALIVVAVLERRFAIAQASNVVSMAKPENQAAVQAIIGAFLSSLLLATKRILWVLFVVLIVAVVTAPYPWAVRARAWVGDAGRAGVGAVRGAEVGPAAAWVGARRDALMLAGAIVAAIILLFASISLGWFLVLAIVLVLYELAVYRIAEASRVRTAEVEI